MLKKVKDNKILLIYKILFKKAKKLEFKIIIIIIIIAIVGKSKIM